MGKRPKEPKEDKEEAVKSLFGTDNPFRRKPQPDAADGEASDSPKPPKNLRSGIDASAVEKETMTEAKIADAEHPDERKRKRDRGIIAAAPSSLSSDEEAIPRKRKKLVKEAEVDGLKNNNKRKRDVVELEYEKRKFGSVGVEPAAAVVAVGEKRKELSAAADMLDTKESFDDESKLLRTVFIGNLPLKTKGKALKREFAKFGEIESVRIRSVPLVDTKVPRKAAVIKGQINREVDSMNAYIVFKEEQSAHAALSNNMTQIDGNHIRVDMACPPRKKMKGVARLYDRKRTIFVGNLPFDVKDEDLYQLFCGLNQSEPNVEAVRVIRDPNTSIGKGIAYVLFKTREAANNACKRRDLKIRDRNLRLSHAKSDAFLSKVMEGPSNGFPHRRSPAASTSTPSEKGGRRKRAAADSASYEGIRSSKTGAVKRKSTFSPHRSSSTGDGGGSRRSSWNEQHDRKMKRPAVAARKAKQLQKRKQPGGSPENGRRVKRARRQ